MTVLSSGSSAAAVPPPVGVSDLGDGRYRNPVLQADYSDPDAIRVGDDYWMVASSFNHAPGLPILHSKDLVNWELVNHALPRLVPEESFAVPQHGKGVWAPSIRFHAGKYWIYYPDPDFGIYVITAADPRGAWSKPVLVRGGRGLIDPCPLWDAAGRLYLIHGWAKSRAGISNRLTLLVLSADGSTVVSDLGVVIDGDKVPVPGFRTLEGPKLYQRNGWYYVFAPAGGVSEGWQSVFRAKNIEGPYEHRIVLDQGATPINGPHQGAWVDTVTGEDWFLHFQDQEAYGRVVHLQPMVWKDGWPVIGEDPDGDGKGQPVLVHAKPNVGSALVAGPLSVPPTSDDFNSPSLGLQWQWQANPQTGWFSLTAKPGMLRLFAQPAPKPGNLYDAPALLLQKFPAREFTVTTKIELNAPADGGSAGLIVFGYDYAWIGLTRRGGALMAVFASRHEAAKGAPQEETVPLGLAGLPRYFRVTVRDGGKCRFSFSVDGVSFTPLGEGDFTATVSRWVGAKVGVFASAPGAPSVAHADFDWVRVEPVQ
jgi:beta-xylosidase